MGIIGFFTATSGDSISQIEPAQTNATTAIQENSEIILEIDESQEITILSEKALSEIWMTPEEDEAWKDL